MNDISKKLRKENKIILVLAIINTAFFFAAPTPLSLFDTILILLLFSVIASRNYLRYTHNIPITEENLSKLEAFGREDDGSFSDRAEFSIVPAKNFKGEVIYWYLTTFDEVDGSRHIIKRLGSLNDLERIYEVLTDNELK